MYTAMHFALLFKLQLISSKVCFLQTKKAQKKRRWVKILPASCLCFFVFKHRTFTSIILIFYIIFTSILFYRLCYTYFIIIVSLSVNTQTDSMCVVCGNKLVHQQKATSFRVHIILRLWTTCNKNFNINVQQQIGLSVIYFHKLNLDNRSNFNCQYNRLFVSFCLVINIYFLWMSVIFLSLFKSDFFKKPLAVNSIIF